MLLMSEEKSLQRPPYSISMTGLEMKQFRASDLVAGLNLNRQSEAALAASQTPGQLKESLSTIEASVASDMQTELRQRSQSAIKRAYEQTTDSFAFLREMVSNAYEACQAHAAGHPTVFDAQGWIDEQGRFVLSMADQGIGMDLQDIIFRLLPPNSTGWTSGRLHFGQGFYSLFRTCD